MGNALAAPHVNVLIVFHNFVQFFLNFLACLARLPFVFDFVCRAPTVHCGEWEGGRGIYDMRASVSVCVCTCGCCTFMWAVWHFKQPPSSIKQDCFI